MESNRWIATVASMWIQSACGASYAFGIYSPILKSSQDYSQSTLDTISVFKDIGANAGILSGIIYSAVAFTPRHHSPSASSSSSFSVVNYGGPWVVLLTGAIQVSAGYLLMWLSVVGVIYRPAVPLMCLFMFVAAHGQTFFNTANVVTAVQNYPDYSGTIVGIMKGCLGLSGAVLIQVYQTLFKGHPSFFLLMLALLPSIVSLLLMCLVRIYDEKTNARDHKKHLNDFSIIIVILAVYLMIIIITENIFPFPLWARIVTSALLLVLLACPLKIATQAQTEDSQRLIQSSSSSSDKTPLILYDDPLLSQSENSSSTEKATTSSTDKRLQDGEDLNIWQAMRTVDFWLLFIAMACGMGSGMATINNISQIGESLGYTTVERNTLVSLWSIWNFFGRLGAGYASDILLHRKGIARPLLMAITLGTMSVGHGIIASGFAGNLFLGSLLVGVSYGSQWSLMPTITSEIYGVRHMGTIFNTISVASPVGSYLLSVRVIGYFYDRAASGAGNSCSGTHCFMVSFFIMAFVTLLAFLIALALFFRTRIFYNLVSVRRLEQIK